MYWCSHVNVNPYAGKVKTEMGSNEQPSTRTLSIASILKLIQKVTWQDYMLLYENMFTYKVSKQLLQCHLIATVCVCVCVRVCVCVCKASSEGGRKMVLSLATYSN